MNFGYKLPLKIRVGRPDYFSGFVRALEILENPGKFLKPWKSLETLEKPWNFFMKPWKISQNFIEKINSSNGAFSGLNNEHLEVTGHSGPDSKSTGPARNRKKPIQILMVVFLRVFFLTEYE